MPRGAGCQDATGPARRVTDVVPLAVFLALDESSWITEEIIRAAGGLVTASLGRVHFC